MGGEGFGLSSGLSAVHLQDSREPACCGSQQFCGPAAVELKCPSASLDRARGAGLLMGGNEKIVIWENLSL